MQSKSAAIPHRFEIHSLNFHDLFNGEVMNKEQMNLQSRLYSGLIPAVPVPFNSSGEIQIAAQESYVRYISTQPVAGVAVWVHTGRGLLLSEKQRRTVLQSWRSGLSKETAIIAGVGSSIAPGVTIDNYISNTLRMGEEALELGADAFLVHPPSLYKWMEGRDRLIIEHHRRIAELGAPIILFFLYEDAGGLSYTPSVLKELFAIPQVIGIKMATLNSVMTYQDVSQQIEREFPDKLLITGEDRFLGYSFMRGAKAALIGMGAALCDLQANMIKSYFAGDASRFLMLSREVDRLAECTFVAPMEGYIRRMLWALAHLGVVPFEAANDPWGPEVPHHEFDRIGEVMKEIEQNTGRNYALSIA